MRVALCGQMHVNTGYYREAVPLASRWLRVFDAYDAIVSPSPSCVGTVLAVRGGGQQADTPPAKSIGLGGASAPGAEGPG